MSESDTEASKTILITGISGMIGRSASTYLSARGHVVRGLSRNPRGSGMYQWDPERGKLDPEALHGVDVVLHLAGEPIDQRWTSRAMNRIRKSRKLGTRLLAERMVKAGVKPELMLSASGINYYGDRQESTLTESDEAGTSFLADVCREWEAATQPATDAGIRVVHMRTGVVLSPTGGALKRLLPIFGKGLGGRIGSGEQRMSWILLEDYLRVLTFVTHHPEIRGPMNMVSPGVVTNAEFTSTLARVLGKPAVIPVPKLAVKLAFGAMGKATLLGDLAVKPEVLEDSGFSFHYPDLEAALSHATGKALPEGE